MSGDWRGTLNISCNFLYCNHQVHRDCLITLYLAVLNDGHDQNVRRALQVFVAKTVEYKLRVGQHTDNSWMWIIVRSVFSPNCPDKLWCPRTTISLSADCYFLAFRVTRTEWNMSNDSNPVKWIRDVLRETSFYVHEIIVGMITGKKTENANLSDCPSVCLFFLPNDIKPRTLKSGSGTNMGEIGISNRNR
jgi:hypothetical protein